MSSSLTGTLAALLYVLTGVLLARRLVRVSQGEKDTKGAALGLGALAAALHAVVLAQTLLLPEGLNLGFFHALSLAGWLIACVLLASAVARPVENLGIVLLPVAALALALALAFGEQRVVTGLRWQIELHILASIFAYALLALAAVQALLLAVQDRHLRRHRPGGLIRGMPALTLMESLLFQMIAGGFVALSVALLSGALFVEDLFAQHLVHKTVLSIAAWLVFGVLLWGRWRHGWRGSKAIRWTLGGFAALALAYFGSKLMLELVLAR